MGDPPVEGMSCLYVETVPGNAVFEIVDAMVKGADVRPGAQIVERHFGMCEVHSLSQADVVRAGEIVLDHLGSAATDRLRPNIASHQIIRRVNPYQAQLLNRNNRGTLIVAGESLLIMEVEPAAYITLAANEAEKAAPVKLNHFTSVGAFGRLWMSGSESDVVAAAAAATAAVQDLEGQTH